VSNKVASGVSTVDLAAEVATLVAAALGDDTVRLVDTAAAELHRPVGLVNAAGFALGGAPDGEPGRRALAVAEAAARSRLVAPPGWEIVALERAGHTVGFAALGASAATDGNVLHDMVTSLLAEHVQRRELVRARRADVVRRLVHEPGAVSAQLRRQAAELGLPLADAYWPALLAWRHLAPRPDVVARIAAHQGMAPGALAVGIADRLVLLAPTGGAEPPGWFAQLVLHARRISPAGGAQAIVAEAPAALEDLNAAVTGLEALWQLGPRADAEPLLSARRFALDRLLAAVAGGGEAQAFVAEQLGSLIAFDAGHRGGLLAVLEASLDLAHQEQAAARCFMHRNTFRHKVRLATEVLGCDLEDPDVRLAVHVALKLRRVLIAR
jgi:sugar diacid utilization regulator